jgi:two-component system nitrogen regulation response regulator GlnG
VSNKPALLVVDDDPLIVDTLSFALGTDYEVLAAESRPEAVALVRRLQPAPQLALVDLGLPPTAHSPEEGFRLIADLLAHSPGMKILVLSGQNEAANARHARALGAWDFVAKPADPAALKRLLDRAAAVAAPAATELIGASAPIEKLGARSRSSPPRPSRC